MTPLRDSSSTTTILFSPNGLPKRSRPLESSLDGRPFGARGKMGLPSDGLAALEGNYSIT
jgi:hypothetical protein